MGKYYFPFVTEHNDKFTLFIFRVIQEIEITEKGLEVGDLENLKTEKDPFFYVQRKVRTKGHSLEVKVRYLEVH